MSSNEFLQLNETIKGETTRVRILKEETERAFAKFATTPSATNYKGLTGLMLRYQDAYQCLSDAKEARREYLKERGLEDGEIQLAD